MRPYYLIQRVVGNDVMQFKSDTRRRRLIVEVNEGVVANDEVFLHEKLLKHETIRAPNTPTHE